MYFYAGNRVAVDEETKKATKQNTKNTNENAHKIEAIAQQLEYLTTVVEALWGITKKHSGLDDNELERQVELVIEEKKALAKEKIQCSSCGQQNSAVRERCAYCGNSLN